MQVTLSEKPSGRNRKGDCTVRTVESVKKVKKVKKVKEVKSVKSVREVKEVKALKASHRPPAIELRNAPASPSPPLLEERAGERRPILVDPPSHGFSPLKENPKYEFRNPKQYQMFETEITKTQSQCTSTVLPVSIIRLSVI